MFTDRIYIKGILREKSDIGNMNSDSEVLTQKSVGNTDPPTLTEEEEAKFSKTRSRAWVFTLNNPTAEDWHTVRNLSQCQYACYAQEIAPETGTPHIQGYLYFTSQRWFHSVKKQLPKAWLGCRAGTHEQARMYCKGPYTSKKGKTKPLNDTFEERGDPPKQGDRNDLADLRAAVESGLRGPKLYEQRELDGVRSKYPRWEEKLIANDDRVKAYEMYENGILPELRVIWGPSNIGKTRYVFDRHALRDVYRLVIGDGTSKSVWWNNYEGQPVILIDDFDGEITYRYLLQITDRYPISMQSKFGYVWRRCTHMYITSNSPPDQWYRAEPDKTPLLRRIKEVIELK